MIEVLKDINSLGTAFSKINSNIEDELSKKVATQENEDIKQSITEHSIHDPNLDIMNHRHPPPERTHTHDDLTIAVPTVTIVELSSKPGCRSFSHKTCQDSCSCA